MAGTSLLNDTHETNVEISGRTSQKGTFWSHYFFDATPDNDAPPGARSVPVPHWLCFGAADV